MGMVKVTVGSDKGEGEYYETRLTRPAAPHRGETTGGGPSGPVVWDETFTFTLQEAKEAIFVQVLFTPPPHCSALFTPPHRTVAHC